MKTMAGNPSFSIFQLLTTILLMTTAQVLEDCPATLQGCFCQRKYTVFDYIYCEEVGTLRTIPPFNLSTPAGNRSYTEVTFRYNTTVQAIQEYAFRGLRIASLRLSGLEINTIHQYAFVGLETHLRELYLDDNKLEYISPDTLIHLKELEYVSLENNRLKGSITYPTGIIYVSVFNNLLGQVDINAFKGIHNLVAIYIGNNGISLLPKGVFNGLEKLLELELNDNLLAVVTGEQLSALTTLERLDLSSNKLTSMEQGLFSSHPYLRYLDLSFNRLEFIPDGLFHQRAALHYLDLSHNRLKLIDKDAFQWLRRLRELRLQDNHLHSLGDSILHPLEQLGHLDVSNNLLVRVPTSNMTHNRLLTFLVSSNRITSVGSSDLEAYPWVGTLDLTNNSISSVQPGAFAKMAYLNTLKLSKNHLDRVTVGLFANLSYLELLYIEDNDVRVMERDSFKDNKRIWYLGLDGNRIQTLPSGIFDQCKTMISLSLARNDLYEFERDVFKSQKSLRALNLDGNSFETLENNALRHLSQLETLTMRNNALTMVSVKSFSNLKALLTLDLSHNHLQTFSTAVLEDSEKLEVLKLGYNQIQAPHRDTYLHLSGLAFLIYLDLSGNRLRRFVLHGLDKEKALVELRLEDNPYDCGSCDMLWMLGVEEGTLHSMEGVQCNTPTSRSSQVVPCFLLTTCWVGSKDFTALRNECDELKLRTLTTTSPATSQTPSTRLTSITAPSTHSTTSVQTNPNYSTPSTLIYDDDNLTAPVNEAVTTKQGTQSTSANPTMSHILSSTTLATNNSTLITTPSVIVTVSSQPISSSTITPINPSGPTTPVTTAVPNTLSISATPATITTSVTSTDLVGSSRSTSKDAGKTLSESTVSPNFSRTIEQVTDDIGSGVPGRMTPESSIKQQNTGAFSTTNGVIDTTMGGSVLSGLDPLLPATTPPLSTVSVPSPTLIGVIDGGMERTDTSDKGGNLGVEQTTPGSPSISLITTHTRNPVSPSQEPEATTQHPLGSSTVATYASHSMESTTQKHKTPSPLLTILISGAPVTKQKPDATNTTPILVGQGQPEWTEAGSPEGPAVSMSRNINTGDNSRGNMVTGGGRAETTGGNVQTTPAGTDNGRLETDLKQNQSPPPPPAPAQTTLDIKTTTVPQHQTDEVVIHSGSDISTSPPSHSDTSSTYPQEEAMSTGADPDPTVNTGIGAGRSSGTLETTRSPGHPSEQVTPSWEQNHGKWSVPTTTAETITVGENVIGLGHVTGSELQTSSLTGSTSSSLASGGAADTSVSKDVTQGPTVASSTPAFTSTKTPSTTNSVPSTKIPSTTNSVTSAKTPPTTNIVTSTKTPSTRDSGTSTKIPSTTNNVTSTKIPSTTNIVTSTKTTSTRDSGTSTKIPSTTNNMTSTKTPPITNIVTSTKTPSTRDSGTSTKTPSTTNNMTSTKTPPTTNRVTSTKTPSTTNNMTSTKTPPTTNRVTSTKTPSTTMSETSTKRQSTTSTITSSETPLTISQTLPTVPTSKVNTSKTTSTTDSPPGFQMLSTNEKAIAGSRDGNTSPGLDNKGDTEQTTQATTTVANSATTADLARFFKRVEQTTSGAASDTMTPSPPVPIKPREEEEPRVPGFRVVNFRPGPAVPTSSSTIPASSSTMTPSGEQQKRPAETGRLWFVRVPAGSATAAPSGETQSPTSERPTAAGFRVLQQPAFSPREARRKRRSLEKGPT